MSSKIKIEKDKPFPPEGFIEERLALMNELLERHPEWVLEQRLREAKLNKIKSKKVRMTKAYGEMLDKLFGLDEMIKRF